MSNNRKFASDTSSRSLAQWIRALLVLLAGLIIAHFGVTLFVLADAGSDTFTVFIQGLSRQAHISLGIMHMIIMVSIMVLMLIFTKGYVKPGTAVCAFCGGPIIDFFSSLLGNVLSSASPVPMRAAGVFAGCVILSLGMSIVINSRAGTGPNDLVALVLSDLTDVLQFRTVRILCDMFFVALGYFLGGTVGLGTVAAVLFIGPMAQFWLPRTEKLTRRLIGDQPGTDSP